MYLFYLLPLLSPKLPSTTSNCRQNRESLPTCHHPYRRNCTSNLPLESTVSYLLSLLPLTCHQFCYHLLPRTCHHYHGQIYHLHHLSATTTSITTITSSTTFTELPSTTSYLLPLLLSDLPSTTSSITPLLTIKTIYHANLPPLQQITYCHL